MAAAVSAITERLPPPAHGEAHVWLAWTERFAAAETLDYCRTLLAQDELEKWRRFHFERDRQLYLVAHAMVRQVLAAYLAIAPERLQFAANRYGRPELVREPGMPDLRFNLSHARGLAALVVTRSADCGIDVEVRRELGDLAAMAGQVLTAAERDYLWRLPDTERNWAFLKLWTLKEATSKQWARGCRWHCMKLDLPSARTSQSASKPAAATLRRVAVRATLSGAGPRVGAGVA